MDIPFRGQLEGGISYFKHGIGCAVGLATGTVDFDFGDDGEIDGVDLDRLTGFARSSWKNTTLRPRIHWRIVLRQRWRQVR